MISTPKEIGWDDPLPLPTSMCQKREGTNKGCAQKKTPPSTDRAFPFPSLAKNCETRSVSAATWLAEADEPDEPLVHELFDEKDRVSIVAQSKARKTFFTLQLAICIASGTPFMGRKVERRRIVIFNFEVNRRQYKKRLRRMACKMGIEPAALEWLEICNLSEESQSADPILDALETAKRLNCTVAVLDPVYKCLGNENDQNEVKEAIRKMTMFAAAGITLIGVYHASKGKIGDKQLIDRVSGSGVFVRDASTIISLVMHATATDHVVMDTSTRNYAPSPPVTISFDDGAFILTDTVPIEMTSYTKPVRRIDPEAVDECFTDEPTKYKDMVDKICKHFGIGLNKGKDLLAEAMQRGTASAIKEGRSTLYTRKAQ